MALINTTTFEIFHQNSVECTDDVYFECDELIAPTIEVLNLKGYKTQYCCSGHPYKDNIEFVVPKELDPEEIFPGIYKVEKVTAKQLKAEGYDISNLKFPCQRVLCKQFINAEAYIMFEEGYMPPTIPNGWSKNKNSISICVDEPETPVFNFLTKRLKVMKALFYWANSLPERKED